MLVLGRKLGEKIIITVDGRRITLSVVSLSMYSVRFGIDAPQDVTINREEVQDAIEIDKEAKRRISDGRGGSTSGADDGRGRPPGGR